VLPEKLIAVIGASKGHSGIVMANNAGSKISLPTLCLGVVSVSKKEAGATWRLISPANTIAADFHRFKILNARILLNVT